MPPGSPSTRLPARASYLRERTLRVGNRLAEGDRPIRLGMDRPSVAADGWWTALVWARDDEGIVSCLDVAPRGGPPPGQPLLRMGPAFAGALSGLVAEVGGRQAIRLRLPAPADPDRPWDRPLVLQLAISWEPVRTATFTPNELAAEALSAFARAIEAAGEPS